MCKAVCRVPWEMRIESGCTLPSRRLQSSRGDDIKITRMLGDGALKNSEEEEINNSLGVLEKVVGRRSGI